MSSETKKRLSHMRKEITKTGGGSSTAAELSLTDRKNLETMGQTATEGIPGGIDTAEPSSLNSPRHFETIVTDR